MTWKDVQLHGAAEVSRVVGEYGVADARIPSRNYRIKVFERSTGYCAFPNVLFRDDTGVSGTCGLGRSEAEALQDCLLQVGDILASRTEWLDRDIEWSDPTEF